MSQGKRIFYMESEGVLLVVTRYLELIYLLPDGWVI